MKGGLTLSHIVKYRRGLLPGDKDTIPRKELQLYEKIEISLTVALADAYQINSHPPINLSGRAILRQFGLLTFGCSIPGVAGVKPPDP